MDLNAKGRLKGLDFLRGLAILLVLLRHQYVSEYFFRIGWTGVDLFFVLSGFLVSGLIFKEYLSSGIFNPVRFLIRRGFKIYPLYYIFIVVYNIPKIVFGEFKIIGFLSEIFFVQNYVWGYGYSFPATWSIAVERTVLT